MHTTHNIFMNHSSDIRLRENRDKCVKQTFLGGDYYKDMLTFARSKKDRIDEWFPYETLADWSKPYPGTNDYRTKLTNLCKSSGRRSHESILALYTKSTDYASSGARESRDGKLTKGSGMQNGEDELFSETGENRDGFNYGGGTNGGGKKGKETDNNAKDRPQRRPFEMTHIKKNIGSEAKESRDGELTKGSGMQNGEDELFSETGENRDGFNYGGGTNGGGKKSKETDNNAKDRPQRSPFEMTDIKKNIGSAAKNISQMVITDFVSELLGSIIDLSIEKGFKNIEYPKILTNALCSSMHTFKKESLTEIRSLFLKSLPLAETQLEFIEGLLQYMFVILKIILMIKDLLEGRLTLRQLVKWLINKAVSLGILYFIASIFGPVGGVPTAAISAAIYVIKQLINRFI